MPTFDTPNSTQSYTVPGGITRIEWDLNGAGGGGGGAAVGSGSGPTSGGVGGLVEGHLNVLGGDAFTLYLGAQGGDGADGDSASNSGGAGGAGGASPLNNGGAGGDGFHDDAESEWSGGGGGGGGETAAERDSDTSRLGTADAGGGGHGQEDDGTTGGAGGGGARGGAGGTGSFDGDPGFDGSGTGEGGDGADNTSGSPGGDGGGTVGVLSDGGVTVGGGNSADPSITVTEQGLKNLATGDITDTAVDLTWTNDAPNITGVDVDYREQGAASWTTFSSLGGTATSETVTGLSAGTTYEFRVVATTADGTTSPPAITDTTGPAAAKDIIVQNAAVDGRLPDDQADITWTDNATTEDAYRVLLTQDAPSANSRTWVNDSGDSAPGSTTTTNDLGPDVESYTTTNLLDGEQYWVAIEVIGNGVVVRTVQN